MGAFIVWLLVSAIVMMMLYGVYSLFLSRQRQPSFNRGVLLSVYALSFVSLFLFRNISFSTADPSASITVIGVESVSHNELHAARLWLQVLLCVYFVGAVLMTIRRLWAQFCLMRIIARGEKISRDGHVLVVSDDNTLATFSWRKYIVMNRADYEEGAEMVMAHELSHLAHRHWIDLLVADVALIIQWFNPAAWMMRDDLKDIHEYQADDSVVAQGFDRQSYQLLLIGKAVGRRVSFVGNSFNQGKLKRRLAMMGTRRSGAAVRSRAAMMLPIIMLLALGVNSGYGRELCGMIDLALAAPPAAVHVDLDETDAPALFVNGERIEQDAINSIDPSTIKVISVRKDQSPNGTIYIETK